MRSKHALSDPPALPVLDEHVENERGSTQSCSHPNNLGGRSLGYRIPGELRPTLWQFIEIRVCPRD